MTSQGRRHRWTAALLGFPMERGRMIGGALVAAQLLGALALVHLVDGTDHAPPHWFYLPIIFAGVRFGVPGAALTALAAGLLAGPLSPADVSAGTAQQTSDWVLRAAFFVAVGTVMTAVLDRALATVRAERIAEAKQAQLHAALDAGQLTLHYQPIVKYSDGTIVGVEALLRWDHPERGLLGPGEFLTDEGHLGSVDTWVIDQACAQLVRWRREVIENRPFWCSVNVSAHKLAQSDFTSQVRNTLAAHGVDPSDLCLEVTEESIIEDLESAAARLEILRSLGVKVAVDDFGTGHASFLYLRHLPIDFVKIDGQLVRGVIDRHRDAAIIASLNDLVDTLGATCIAEGVETSEQLRAVGTAGCLLAQGYHLGRPVAADQLAPLLAAGCITHDSEAHHHGARTPATTTKPSSSIPRGTSGDG